MKRPADAEEVIQNLNNEPEEKWRKEFRDTAEELRRSFIAISKSFVEHRTNPCLERLSLPLLANM